MSERVTAFVRSHQGAAVLLAVVILILYGRTLGYGLFWDDYAELRPRSLEAVLGAWTGPWDPDGVWPAFYRPLTLMLYAGVFEVFGQNAVALHALSLLILFGVALMVRTFVARECGIWDVGLGAALLLVTHPETPASLAAWISQQFHLSALVAVLATLLVWQQVRSRPWEAWTWLLLPLTAGVLIKEDSLMVMPGLVGWHYIRRRVVGDVPAIPKQSLVMLTIWAIAYLAWRWAMLGQVGGYTLPSATRAALNLVGAPIYTFALQWIPNAHGISVVTGVGVLCLAVLWWRARQSAPPVFASLAAGGVWVGACATLPLVMIGNHTRVHMLILAAAVTGAAVAAIVVDAHRRGHRLIARSVAAVLVVALGAMLLANWRHTSTFAACSVHTLGRDAEVLEWDIVSADTKVALRAKMAACQ